jgi:hypothetical protein
MVNSNYEKTVSQVFSISEESELEYCTSVSSALGEGKTLFIRNPHTTCLYRATIFSNHYFEMFSTNFGTIGDKHISQ